MFAFTVSGTSIHRRSIEIIGLGHDPMQIYDSNHPPRGMRRVGSWALLEADHAEQTVEVVLRSGGVEELVGLAVGRSATTEFDSPELVDLDGLAHSIDYGSNEGAGRKGEAVDGTGVGVVADQQGVAERAEVRGGDGEPPRLVEGRA